MCQAKKKTNDIHLKLTRSKQFVKEMTAGKAGEGSWRQSSHGRSQGQAPWQGWEWIDLNSVFKRVQTEI